jgi:hypothetical protein
VYLKKHLSVSVRSITWLREPFTQTWSNQLTLMLT